MAATRRSREHCIGVRWQLGVRRLARASPYSLPADPPTRHLALGDRTHARLRTRGDLNVASPGSHNQITDRHTTAALPLRSQSDVLTTAKSDCATPATALRARGGGSGC